jgi:hypothetical protein
VSATSTSAKKDGKRPQIAAKLPAPDFDAQPAPGKNSAVSKLLRNITVTVLTYLEVVHWKLDEVTKKGFVCARLMERVIFHGDCL